jgi:hypothetical protein
MPLQAVQTKLSLSPPFPGFPVFVHVSGGTSTLSLFPQSPFSDAGGNNLGLL